MGLCAHTDEAYSCSSEVQRAALFLAAQCGPECPGAAQEMWGHNSAQPLRKRSQPLSPLLPRTCSGRFSTRTRCRSRTWWWHRCWGCSRARPARGACRRTPWWQSAPWWKVGAALGVLGGAGLGRARALPSLFDYLAKKPALVPALLEVRFWPHSSPHLSLKPWDCLIMLDCVSWMNSSFSVNNVVTMQILPGKRARTTLCGAEHNGNLLASCCCSAGWTLSQWFILACCLSPVAVLGCFCQWLIYSHCSYLKEITPAKSSVRAGQDLWS